MPIIVPIHSGGGGEMTDKDIKIFIGIFIVLNIWWVISLLITLFKNKFKIKELLYCRFDELIGILDFAMFLIWLFVILGFLGYQVSKFL